MHNLKSCFFVIFSLILLVGCQPENEPLPTLVNLDATNEALSIAQAATDDALSFVQTQTAAAPTATSVRPTLPPTFTPTPIIIPSNTPIPTSDPNISPTPEGYRADGTIYYNYNGDSIARLFPDGSLNEIIVTFGIDRPITDLTASPNGQLLAFVAPSAGSAREVWVSNRDGSYLQQVSCLGFAEVRSPAFAFDNNRIAFFGAPLGTSNMSLYVADFAGSNDCPTGNNQQMIAVLDTPDTGEIAWSADNSLIYYGAKGTFVYDIATNTSYQISFTRGFGADVGMSYNPTTDQLVYLQKTRDLSTGRNGGDIVILNDADVAQETYTISPIPAFARDIVWGGNNESLIYSTDTEIVYFEYLNNSRLILQENLSNPLIEAAPKGESYVYTRVDAETGIPQLHIANRLNDRVAKQLTFNPEGAIIDVVWLEG